ncbi:MAG: xylose isomerase [Planctomycetaceae bacterium]|nr:xylose isomerase [Planctomycetaceae bacterium]
MSDFSDRREFLVATTAAGAGLALGARPMNAYADGHDEGPLFKISLAQWSLHRTLRQGKLKNLDFPGFAKSEFGIEAVEYVNHFFKDKAKDKAYLKELRQRAQEAGVRNVLIMCDGEGLLGDPDESQRKQAVENHYKWVEAAKYLGCHAIRVNAASSGSFEEQRKLAADGLRRLSMFGQQHEMSVIVENHGGLSSHGGWLSSVIRGVNLPNCGTLPDFGNFRIGDNDSDLPEWYDRYLGVEQLMPYAKAVSAKSHAFDSDGYETNTDYQKMMQIVLKAGYRGYVGIEWEGGKPSEVEGIRLTKQLLERVRDQLSEKKS